MLEKKRLSTIPVKWPGNLNKLFRGKYAIKTPIEGIVHEAGKGHSALAI